MKNFLAIVLGLSLLFSTTMDSVAGPRSYSSGSSSSKPSYSSGSSSKPSYSSGSSSKPSYSSGSSSKPSYSKPSYSSGSSSSATTSKPISVPRPVSTTPAPSGGSKSYSSGGSKSYSSGVPPSTPSVAPKPSPGHSPGKSYGSGNATYSPAPISSPNSKGGVSYDSSAAAAQKRAESKANYIKGSEPKTTYTTPTGQSAPINTSSGSYRHVHTINHDTYATRDVRVHAFYSTGYIGVPYYTRPIVVYNDPYNSLFWYWMLDRSIEHRAMWAYSHRAEMDAARYQALLAKDAQLAARVRELELQKVKADPTYVPPGLSNPDLMYTDDYVNSVYNPHIVEHHPASSGIGTVLFWIFMILLGIVVLVVVYNLVFVKKW